MFSYTQLGIGDCGHTVCVWPQFSGIGGKEVKVFCEDCAREQYGIADEERFILVTLVEKKPTRAAKRPRNAPKREPRQPKPKSAWQRLLEQEGLF